MENIVSTAKWLQIIAADLDSKSFPNGYGVRLRHVAEIFDTHTAQVQALEEEAAKVSFDFLKLEEHTVKLSKDFKETWRRLQLAIEILEKYDPAAADNLKQYRPFFYSMLVPSAE